MTGQIQGIRDAITRILAESRQPDPIGDHDSLFLSGKLDSVAAMDVLMLLEGDYGIDLSDADFDITEIDTIAKIEVLAAKRRAAA